MNYDHEIDQIRRRAEQQGWRYERLSNNHHRFLSPDHVTIVQASSSSRDPNALKFVLNDLKRAGYVHEEKASPSAIALAMQEAQGKANGRSHGPVTLTRGTLSNAIRDCMRMHPEKIFTIQNVCDYLRARGLPADNNRIGIILSRFAVQYEITRIETGTYRWGTRGGASLSIKPTVVVAQPVNGAALSPGVPHGIQPGDELRMDVHIKDAAITDDQDPDERELDEALAALGRIESVVRRFKVKIKRFNEMKKLLTSVELEP